MKGSILAFLIVLLIGCSSGLTEQRVEQDFRGLIEADYRAIGVEKVQRVSFGDGWGDGVEVRVYFEATCKAGVAADQSAECRNGPMQMQMSYQKNSAGNWGVLSSSVLAAE